MTVPLAVDDPFIAHLLEGKGWAYAVVTCSCGHYDETVVTHTTRQATIDAIRASDCTACRKAFLATPEMRQKTLEDTLRSVAEWGSE